MRGFHLRDVQIGRHFQQGGSVHRQYPCQHRIDGAIAGVEGFQERDELPLRRTMLLHVINGRHLIQYRHHPVKVLISAVLKVRREGIEYISFPVTRGRSYFVFYVTKIRKSTRDMGGGGAYRQP